jgi:hypothetical protein
MTGSPNEETWSECPPAERPVQVTGAAALLIVSALISASIALNDPAMTQFVYLLLFVTIGAAIRLCGGGRKARGTATVTAGLFLLYLGPHVIWGLSDPHGPFEQEYAVRAILAIAGTGTGVGLLYTPQSRGFFRAVRRRSADR